jgi:hypothetical protein
VFTHTCTHTRAHTHAHTDAAHYADNDDGYDEYDGDDGRLWFRREFRYLLTDLFGKTHTETMAFVGKYFENKFGVEVNKVE